MNWGEVIGTALAAVVVSVTGTIGWARTKRIQDARADATVAVAHAEEAKHEGQAGEIERLSKAVGVLSTELSKLKTEVADLRARLQVLKVLLPTLELCDPCRTKYKTTLEIITKHLGDDAP